MRISCVGRGRSNKKCPLSACACAEASPPKSGFSRESSFRFRRTVQQTGAFSQTALSMERYCAISFQRPLYEPLIRIFRRPVMVLRVSELRDPFTFIPVSPKCFTFATTTWSWFESKFGTPRWAPRRPTVRPKPQKYRNFRLPPCAAKVARWTPNILHCVQKTLFLILKRIFWRSLTWL